MNKIILTAEADLRDEGLREVVEKLWVKVETINERTKRHTMQIKTLEKRKKKND